MGESIFFLVVAVYSQRVLVLAKAHCQHALRIPVAICLSIIPCYKGEGFG